MDEKKLAQAILENIGGKENVVHLEHCSTRLRFTLIDDTQANKESLQSLNGVLGVVQNVQTQIIIGGAVVEVFNEINKLLDSSNLKENSNIPNKKQKISAVIIDFIVSIFQPLIPAIAGGGILKSLLMLLNLLGVLDKTTSTYQILMFIGDAPLYFLPLLVAITTATKLKVNSLVAVSAVGGLLLPNLAAMISEGTTLAGLPIQNINYAYQVFPAILCVVAYSFAEKFFNRISPKVIRTFFVPMMSLLIVVPLTLLVLGPIGFTFGQVFASVILSVFAKFGWIAVALLAAFLPFLVVTGMHKAMIPYVITSLGETGKELIYNAASLAHNMSEAGACFAVSLRAKDKNLRATALSSGISALFGITEPALYGVTILHKRVLYSVMIGGLFGGATLGLLSVEAYVAVGPGIASLSMFISETLPKNFMFAIIGLIVSFVVSFVAVFVLFKETVNEEKVVSKNSNKTSTVLAFNAPMKGKVIDLAEVNDSVFSSKMLGEGVAIIPSVGELYAPVDGEITMVYNTKHSLGMTTKDGVEILFHIGIDTVNLKGQYFDCLVQEGQVVKQGDLLIRFDLEQIKEAGFDPTTMMVITESKNMQMGPYTEKEATKSDQIFILEGENVHAIA